jgi:hypothetical protein
MADSTKITLHIFILGTNFISRPSLATEGALRCSMECEVALEPDVPMFEQFSPTSCHFIPLWFKYFPLHPIFKHSHYMFLPCVRKQVSQAYRTKITVLYILPFMSRGSLVGITTGYGLDDRGITVRVPVGSRIFTSPYRPDRLWGPHNLLSNG